MVKYALMRLYIVRHGESESNAANIFQDGTSSLSKEGFKQAKELGKRVSKLKNIDLIICSPHLRTRQTLEEIQKIRKHEVEFNDLAIELVRASELIGIGYDVPKAMEVKRLIKENRHDPEWHFSDEENFYDLRDRASKLIKEIETKGEKNILLVCHGILAKTLVSVMLFGNELNHKVGDAMEHFMRTNNTGITVCEKHGNSSWKLVTWNDHSHLG